jgi:hypothetical protein
MAESMLPPDSVCEEVNVAGGIYGYAATRHDLALCGCAAVSRKSGRSVADHGGDIAAGRCLADAIVVLIRDIDVVGTIRGEALRIAPLGPIGWGVVARIAISAVAGPQSKCCTAAAAAGNHRAKKARRRRESGQTSSANRVSLLPPFSKAGE